MNKIQTDKRRWHFSTIFSLSFEFAISFSFFPIFFSNKIPHRNMQKARKNKSKKVGCNRNEAPLRLNPISINHREWRTICDKFSMPRIFLVFLYIAFFCLHFAIGVPFLLLLLFSFFIVWFFLFVTAKNVGH